MDSSAETERECSRQKLRGNIGNTAEKSSVSRIYEIEQRAKSWLVGTGRDGVAEAP